MTQQQNDPQDLEAVARLARLLPGLRRQLIDPCGSPTCSCQEEGYGWEYVSEPESLAYLVAHPEFWGIERDGSVFDASWGYPDREIHASGPSAIQALARAIAAAEEAQNG